MKERFIEFTKNIIEINGNKIELKDFEDIEEMKDKKIKLNNLSTMELKRCLIDELGSLKKGFETLYNYYIKDEKLIIRIEITEN